MMNAREDDYLRVDEERSGRLEVNLGSGYENLQVQAGPVACDP